jgi:hypothetical protein
MKILRIPIFALLLSLVVVPSFLGLNSMPVSAQQPTVAIPTVTGTAIGAYIVVNADQEQINVRGGPGTDYSAVGVLVAGQLVSAKGRSAAGLWVQINYQGTEGGLAWVYSPLVTIFQAAELPIVAPPPTPTLRVTPTIDPTLAAQFIQEIPATRLPTFTAPEPLAQLSFSDGTPLQPGGIPIGMYITFIGLLGLFGAIISFLRDR